MLSKIAFFSGLPAEVLQKLSEISEVVEAEKGRVIFTEGERATALWCVFRGKVKIYKISLDGKEQILTVAEDGDTFGEVAVLKGSLYPAYAEAMVSSVLVKLPVTALISLVKREPMVALGLLGAMAEKLKTLNKMVENLSLREVPARLASYLLEESGGKDIVMLHIPKGELAKLLGTTA